MLVSVVVPVYNGEATLGKCIDALIAQDFTSGPYEILIVDNGSTDGTWSLIESYGDQIRGIREVEIQSSYAARNRGIVESCGAFIAFTDSDCIPEPDWLRQLIDGFDDPAIGCVGGRVDSLPPNTAAERYTMRRGTLNQESYYKSTYRPYFATANVAYRREVLDQLGGFEATWESSGDVDLCWRMLEQTDWQIRYQPEAAVLHHHRTTWRGLWKQYRRYGRGRAALQQRYPDFGAPWYKSGIEAVRRLLRLAGQAGKYSILTLTSPLSGSPNRENLEFAFYAFVTQIAFVLGVREGVRKQAGKA